MDSFEDALDRLDFDWGADYSDEELKDALALALGMPFRSELFKPSPEQIRVAGVDKQRRDQVMTDLGFQIGTFQRGGMQVSQLRDARGRFVTSGAANITARLAEGSG